jgi:cytoskeletal protein CcmA (bactofilin family)
MRWLYPEKPRREVHCFNCGHPFSTIGEAQSSQCPKCGGYISLLDYDISEVWNRRIQTGGNVVIRKTGSISGVTVRCHHLTVLGELAGAVECSGDLVIRNHGKITGTVQCRHLRIEKGARVEFLNPVNATTATIDGNVRGQISCTGAITLEKRARLQGLVRTSSLVVKSGAKHIGIIEMLTDPPAPPA